MAHDVVRREGAADKSEKATIDSIVATFEIIDTQNRSVRCYLHRPERAFAGQPQQAGCWAADIRFGRKVSPRRPWLDPLSFQG
jgi:hypothetical protein